MEGFKKHVRRLTGLLRRRGNSREDAEDLIQEAFLRLHMYCRTSDVREPEAFLVRTVINLAVDRRRREHRGRYVDQALEDLPLIDLKPTPDEDLAIQQRLDQARAVLDALNPRTREVFLMHRAEGYSSLQIAQRFDISISAVEKHIARAVLTLMDVTEHR